MRNLSVSNGSGSQFLFYVWDAHLGFQSGVQGMNGWMFVAALVQPGSSFIFSPLRGTPCA